MYTIWCMHEFCWFTGYATQFQPMSAVWSLVGLKEWMLGARWAANNDMTLTYKTVGERRNVPWARLSRQNISTCRAYTEVVQLFRYQSTCAGLQLSVCFDLERHLCTWCWLCFCFWTYDISGASAPNALCKHDRKEALWHLYSRPMCTHSKNSV